MTEHGWFDEVEQDREGVGAGSQCRTPWFVQVVLGSVRPDACRDSTPDVVAVVVPVLVEPPVLRHAASLGRTG